MLRAAEPSPPDADVAPAAPAGEPDCPAVRDAVLFGARLRDAFDEARARLLVDFAAEVLARELQLAPAAIDAIAQRLLDEARAESPVALRLHPQECGLIAADVRVEPDPALRRGDAVVVVRDGALESRLGVRLEAILRAEERR